LYIWDIKSYQIQDASHKKVQDQKIAVTAIS